MRTRTPTPLSPRSPRSCTARRRKRRVERKPPNVTAVVMSAIQASRQTTGVDNAQVCPSCGAAVADGIAGCQRLFESLGLREFEDMRFARYHRIVVDVYAMQHPDRYGRSAKSFAAHLTGLCAWLEDEAGAPAVNSAVQRWLSGP